MLAGQMLHSDVAILVSALPNSVNVCAHVITIEITYHYNLSSAAIIVIG